MNSTITIDSADPYLQNKPGAQLALIRNQKGYSAEYVAGKLHLRLHIIQLLEADDYDNMPEPVFIKGYLRAYAKLLEIPSEDFIETFNRYYGAERKSERAPLWQSRKQTYKTEYGVHWFTGFFAIAVLVAVFMWWNKSKDEQVTLPTAMNQNQTEIRLTDLSKMRSLLSSVSETVPAEEVSE